MIPLDEFFSFSQEKQSSLVDGGHVVVNGELADEVPHRSQTDVYVFEDSVTGQVVQLLERGQYKTKEIEPELPLTREALDDVISNLRYNRRDTLTDYKGVVRATGKDGAANIYTVDPLPFEIRTRDPTLSGYLLVSSGIFSNGHPKAETARSESSYDSYVDLVEDYWGLPEEELRTEIDPDEKFVRSTVGPLPMPSELPNEDAVRNRILDVEDAYVHKQYSPRKVHHGISLRKSRVRRNPSLPAFQEFASYLADVYRYARLENDSELRDLSKKGAKLYFRCLYGNYRPGDQTEWTPFRVELTDTDLSKLDRRVIDIVELQPTKNSELAEHWGFDDSSRVFHYIRDNLDQFSMRNNDQFICATEAGRRRILKLADQGSIQINKTPPTVPVPAKTPIKEPDPKDTEGRNTTSNDASVANEEPNGSSSGVNWTNHQSSTDKSRRSNSGRKSTGGSEEAKDPEDVEDVEEAKDPEDVEDVEEAKDPEDVEDVEEAKDPEDVEKGETVEDTDSAEATEQAADPTRLDLLAELIKLESDLGRVPDDSDVREAALYEVTDYEQEFDSVEQALTAAGIGKKD